MQPGIRRHQRWGSDDRYRRRYRPKPWKWREIIAKNTARSNTLLIMNRTATMSAKLFFQGHGWSPTKAPDKLSWRCPRQMRKKDIKRPSRQIMSWFETFKYSPPNHYFTKRNTLYVGDHTFQIMHLAGSYPLSAGVFIPEEKVYLHLDNVTPIKSPVIRCSTQNRLNGFEVAKKKLAESWMPK